MNPKRVSQRARALTIYFTTSEEKREFVRRATRLGLTASFVGLLCLTRGIETGVLDQLDKVVVDDQAAVKSKERPRTRPRTKTKKS